MTQQRQRHVDPDFLELPLRELAAAVLDTARRAGAVHADLRVHRLTTQSLNLRDGAVQSAVDGSEIGLAVRVVIDGTWGFASHSDLSVAAAVRTAKTAVDVATALRGLNREHVELAGEPIYADATWVSDYEVDPFDIATRDKVELLAEYSSRLAASDGVDHVTASVQQVKEQTFYADSAGSSITQQRVRLHPQFEATTVDSDAGAFETMRTLAPPVSRGWEYLAADSTWDWADELARIPDWLGEKVKSPSVVAGPTDLVIDPTNLWLTIHESIGHATEYDRAIGYEAAYAGTSFATPDKLGTLQYGSESMHVTADRTEVHGLASTGYDDEGVAAQKWDLVRDGVLVGYQLDRVFAPRLGLSRSNGCSYADSAHHVPIQRMANVSLQPDPNVDRSIDDLVAAVEDGIYVVGDKSWSIDMQRYNFQFTGQRFFRIRHGRLEGQVRDVAYQATTTDFWGSMDLLGGESTRRLGGAFNCGKAQPGQVAAVSHGCPAALSRRQCTRHPIGGGPMIRAQDVVEQVLRAATVDETLVIVTDSSESSLRWANNSMTTNGVGVSRRWTVVSIVRGDDGTRVSTSSSSSVDPKDIVVTVRASENAARTAESAEDAMPLVEGGAAAPDWDADPARTDIGVFESLTGPLSTGFDGQDQLYGFAHHQIETVWLGSSTGIRRRYTQPTGSIEINGKRSDASAWVGASTKYFDDVSIEKLLENLSTRLDWSKNRIDLPAGRYETLLPPSAVADMMIYLMWSMEGRGAQEGHTALSRAGGTRIGEKLGRLPLTLFSDPRQEGLEYSPFVATGSSNDSVSLFDNGVSTSRVEWIRNGTINALAYPRFLAEKYDTDLTVPGDNLALTGGSDTTLEEMVARTERGLLLSTLWYIREVDPATLLLTGLTRDGVYLVENGKVVGAVNNFRFNESPLDLLRRATEAGATEKALPREWKDWFTRTAMPPLRIPDFHMSSVSEAQ